MRIEDPKKLTKRQIQVLDLYMGGMTGKNIATHLGMSWIYIRKAMNTPSFVAEVARIKAETNELLHNKINNSAIDALNVVIDAMTSRNVNAVNLKSAELILKLSGLDPVVQMNIRAQVEGKIDTQLTLSTENKKQILLDMLEEKNIEDDIDD